MNADTTLAVAEATPATGDTLSRICAATAAETARRKAMKPLDEIASEARSAPPPRGFREALAARVAAGGFGLIAEIKKASPSKGLIRPDFDPASLAGAYHEAGATCLSVLTDRPWFQGEPAHLQAARAAVPLPVLRKDFMLEPWQIYESRAIGADCVLLIMAALDDTIAAEMESLAHALGMDVLVEVHDAPELQRALRLKSPLIGINNRNLKTLAVDLATTEELAPLLPAERELVCESGIATQADVDRMAQAGARRFLIGESLMRQEDVSAAVRAVFGGLP